MARTPGFRYAAAGCILVAFLAGPTPASAGQEGGTGEASAGEGISQEEYLRTFPPAPENLRAALVDGGVIVFWERPASPGPEETVGYDPRIETTGSTCLARA